MAFTSPNAAYVSKRSQALVNAEWEKGGTWHDKTIFDGMASRGSRAFGTDPKDWKFVCPSCGTIQSVKDFLQLGCCPDDAVQECIGLHKWKSSLKQGEALGCGCTSYGIIGTMGKGRIVTDLKGYSAEVFDFAPME